jgi:hypothetical protein
MVSPSDVVLGVREIRGRLFASVTKGGLQPTRPVCSAGRQLIRAEA